ncbi:MAG: OadG family protein [Desulfohalobiaceae bacterium]|nr:OadG family protein [Desulfohalobiaceae bacterium]
MNDLILGVQLTVLGMGMVLFILSILYLAVAVMGRVINRETGEPVSAPGDQPSPSVPAEDLEAEEDLPHVPDNRKRVAAISAAVAAYKGLQRARTFKSPHMVPYKDETRFPGA